MNTKVKGDKIKEGSIPLSALSSDMNIPSYIDFVKKLSNEDVNNTLIIPYASQVVLVSNIDTRILNGGESTTYSHYGMTFTFTASLASSNLELHIEGNGSLNAFDIKVYKGINKIKKEFLPDDIGGADWNAQPGKAGYIENKPFYGGNVIRTVGSGVIMSSKSFTINNYYRAKITTFRYYNSEGEYTDIDFDLKTDFDSTIVGDEFELYVSYNINYTNATIEFVELTLNGGWIAFFVDEYDTIKALEDKYIPDTVLKTTPQTLSDDDKNQALANLGIKTIAAKQYRTIPSELLDSDELVYQNPNYYIFEEGLKKIAIAEVYGDCLKTYDGRFVRAVNRGDRYEWQLDEDQ